MEFWNVPPRIKVLKAIYLLANGRKRWLSSNIFEIDGEKVHINGNGIYSNGRKYRYLDEYCVAALMEKGLLTSSERFVEAMKGYEWDDEKHHIILEKEVKSFLEKRKIYEKEVDAFINLVCDEIRRKKFKVLKVPKKQGSIIHFCE